MGTLTAFRCELNGPLRVHIDNVNKRTVMDIPSTGYVVPTRVTKRGPRVGPSAGHDFAPARVPVCPSVHSGHDLAYVAACRCRRRDDRSDPVLRGQAPVVPHPTGSLGQTRGGEVAGR